MTWETDGMMRCLKDGQEIWRAVDYVQVQREPMLRGGSPTYSHPVPVLFGSETIKWVLGDDRPHIITVRGGM